MANQTRQHTGQQNLDSLMDFEDHELKATMNEFLEDEKKANNNSVLTPILSSNIKPLKIFFNIKITYDFPELNK